MCVLEKQSDFNGNNPVSFGRYTTADKSLSFPELRTQNELDMVGPMANSAKMKPVLHLLRLMGLVDGRNI